jgi:Ca-activated chloride channel family protein
MLCKSPDLAYYVPTAMVAAAASHAHWGSVLTRALHRAFLVPILVILTHAVSAQDTPQLQQSGIYAPTPALIGSSLDNMSMWTLVTAGHSPLEGLSGSVSKLDLKAPGKARREYDKGYQLLMRKHFTAAVEHLTTAISIYPEFVAAHNALGNAYLDLGQSDQARAQFAQAVLLDDHLPKSYLNLGCSQLFLKDYHSAEESVQKASALAPLDLQLATALTYAQFMNQDYGAVLATARQVHSRKHQGAAIVHYFAAAALDSQNNPQEEQSELQTLLEEDPESPAAEQARRALAQIKLEQIGKEAWKSQPPASSLASSSEFKPAEVRSTAEEAVAQVVAQRQIAFQDSREQKQITEAEAEPEPEAMCAACSRLASPSGAAVAGPRGPSASVERAEHTYTPFTLRSVVDEVAVFFAATDHGKSVTGLTREEVGIRDDQKSPAAITGFRSEAQLPLRLGIIIDTSESVTQRFSFEQRAAIDFLQKILTDTNDLAFVVGVANSVLLVQDFTSDQQRIFHAIDQLAPAGGTALWDAVAFAADKLADRAETQPVARMLVVISDGKDNSSSTSLQDAIASAERGEVFVYTVSTREVNDRDDYFLVNDQAVVGDRALKVLADHTGGAVFEPGSVSGLNRGLDELQQVIRSRYLISYKPALFKHNGQYHAIEITAQKSGHKLRVYSRRGYYARVTPTRAANEVSE